MAFAVAGSVPAVHWKRQGARPSSRAVRLRAVCSQQQQEKGDDVQQLTRRDAITLAASSAVFAAMEAPAHAETGPLGLRKSGNGGNRRIPASEYTVLPSGVKYYDVQEGSGAITKKGDRIAVHYDCKFRTLTIATSRQGAGVTGGVPYGYSLGVKAGTPGGPFIEGLNEGVVGMRVGGQRKLIVPPEFAYGDRQVQEIPPNATLNFEVELLSIGKTSPFAKG